MGGKARVFLVELGGSWWGWRGGDDGWKSGRPRASAMRLELRGLSLLLVVCFGLDVDGFGLLGRLVDGLD
jgi:hypothetical protein